MGRQVRVVYRKFDNSLHWHFTAGWLGEDEHGTWVGSPPHAMRKGDGPAVPIEHAHVGLFPHTGWWTAWFNARPAKLDIYVDVTTPAVWTDDRAEVSAVDLDLDVCRWRRWRRAEVLDEDEFALHQVRYGYSDDVIRQARRTADELLVAIRRRVEPFGRRYRHWLSQLDSDRLGPRGHAQLRRLLARLLEEN